MEKDLECREHNISDFLEEQDVKNNIRKVFDERKDNIVGQDTYQEIKIPERMIPKGSELVECYMTDKEIIVIGMPNSDDESHNCDEMGCGSLSHVIYRFDISDSKQYK